MGIADAKIVRIYACGNEECEGKISVEQKVSDKWRKKCPFCNKHSLYLDSATSSISVLMNTKNQTTLGSISDKNKARREKEGEEHVDPRGRVPFWRKQQKINYSVLKDPKKYVMTGQC